MTTVTAAPYSVTLAGFNLGSYNFTAVATDNSGASTTSAPVNISVTSGASQVYSIHTDQLNTPRLITDSNSAKVWEWNNDDPFGNNPANDDPNATGRHFTFNQRFAGQYADKETGLFYNWNRFYRPDTGTYDQSDLIGLGGGVNTYSYALQNPLWYSDSNGLRTEVTIWHPVGWGASSFGHVSTDINGTVYSYGKAGMWEGSATDYYKKNNFRDGQGVVIPLTPMQEIKLLGCMRTDHGGYDATKNNCGSPIQDCLKELGIDTENQVLPVNLGDKLLDIGIPDKSSQHPASSPSNGLNAPWAR